MRVASRLAAAVLAIGLGAGQAAGVTLYSPAGTWVTNGGESKYELRLCGDGDDLCAVMTWANDSDLGRKLKPFVGQNMVLEAPRIGDQLWRGRLTWQGHTVRGNIELRDRNTIHIKGCNGAVCQTVELLRVDG